MSGLLVRLRALAMTDDVGTSPFSGSTTAARTTSERSRSYPQRTTPDRPGTPRDGAEATLPRRRQRATIVAMSTEPLRAVRDHLSEVVDRVEHQHERVIVTRNGHAAAVLISPEDLAQLEETIDVLSDPDALADIREADAAYARGDVLRGVDAVRNIR